MQTALTLAVAMLGWKATTKFAAEGCVFTLSPYHPCSCPVSPWAVMTPAGPTAKKLPPLQSEQGKWDKGSVPGLSASITNGHLLHFIQVFSDSMPVVLGACSQSMNRTSTSAEGPDPRLFGDGWVSVCRAGGGSFLTAGVMQLSPGRSTAAGFSSMPPSQPVCLAVQQQHCRSRSRNVGQTDLSLSTQ